VTGAEIGERWRIGTSGLELELTGPRIPCATFARHMARHGIPERGWVKRFTERGVPGAYFAVLTPGPVRAGDTVEVVHRPGHGVTLGESFLSDDPDLFQRLLDAEAAGAVRLYDDMRRHARKVTAR
jgi:MOSC domain-containing protein YiiM